MTKAAPLPAYLIQKFQGWKSSKFAEQNALYKHLADEGQKPPAMVISCCDSRVNPTALFDTDPGEFFIHRNIANFVPPYSMTGDNHGTSAALEYAVTSLGVSHIIVIGHSACGGVNGCYQMCSGKAPQLEKSTSFVGRWIDLLRPAFERVKHLDSEEKQIAALELEGILLSLENLMGFPFVKQGVENGTLTLHGLWNDIGAGELYCYDEKSGKFEQLT
ncbi:MAG: carbonic anhydrase [Candidatus Puniceispirillum sp.]